MSVPTLNSIADPNSDLLRGRDPEGRYAVKASDGGATLIPLPAVAPPNEFRPRGQFLFAEPGNATPVPSAISANVRWLVHGVIGLDPFAYFPKVPVKPRKQFPTEWPLPTLVDRKTGARQDLPCDRDFAARMALISPDARHVVVASSSKYHLWQVDPLKHFAVLDRQESSGMGPVAFSPEGKMLAVAQSQWDVRLIDPESLEELATLRAPNPEVLTWLCFSPDGRRLAACTQDGRIQVWDVMAIRRQLAAMGLDWKLRPWAPDAGK